MIIKIAIAENNEVYLERLMNVFEEYEELSLSVYTDKRSLENALSARHFDVLLFNPEIFDGQMSLDKTTVAVLLLDESKRVPESCADFAKVKKYQRISMIYKRILELYAEICGNVGKILGQRSVTAIGFYSPIGGAGKTTLALVTATKLAMKGYRTFYINLEDVSSEDCYLPQNGEKGLSEMVSSLESNVNFQMKSQSLLQTKQDNLFYMNHFESPNDVYEITGEEIDELLKKFINTGLFDYIIIDLGVSLNKKMLQVFESVDKIVLIEKPDAISRKKMTTFFNQVHIIKEYGNKMYRIMNFENGHSSAVQTNIPMIGKVGVVQNPDPAQLITMLSINSGLGYISALVG